MLPNNVFRRRYFKTAAGFAGLQSSYPKRTDDFEKVMLREELLDESLSSIPYLVSTNHLLRNYRA
jgi:hypothetical protein